MLENTIQLMEEILKWFWYDMTAGQALFILIGIHALDKCEGALQYWINIFEKHIIRLQKKRKMKG